MTLLVATSADIGVEGRDAALEELQSAWVTPLGGATEVVGVVVDMVMGFLSSCIYPSIPHSRTATSRSECRPVAVGPASPKKF